MASIVSDIITESFVDLGVIQPGETISSDMLANAFLVLNQMWSSWSVERTVANVVYHQSFAIVPGTSKYTLGTAGTLSASARPIRVTAWNSSFGNFSTGGPILDFDQFRAKTLNATSRRSQLPELLAADQAYPNINIEVFPPPDLSPGVLTLDYWGPVVPFAATNTTLNLADGYESALHYNLAVALSPQYARTSGITQELAANAQNSKSVIMQKNADILGLSGPTPAGPQAAAQQ